MEATLRLARRATYADYLSVEQNSEARHELIDGVIVAMAGGSDEHNAIASRLAMLVGNRLSPPCRHYSPDQRFWIASRARGRYSDGSVICGKPEHPAHDPQATTSPSIVFEVLSPSSEGDDDGDKRLDFQSLPTLVAYVLVAQDQRSVKVYRRGQDGNWVDRPDMLRDGEQFELPTLSSAIGVGELYDGILDAKGVSLL
jgi:Uma2 family endonuclease